MGRNLGQDVEITLKPLKKRGRQPFDPGAVFEFPAPDARNGIDAQIGAGDRSCHRPKGVAIPAVQDGTEKTLFKGLGVLKKGIDRERQGLVDRNGSA